MAHRLVINGTEKGGVGKTHFTIHVLEWYHRELKLKALGFNPEATSVKLREYLPDITQNVSVEEYGNLDEVVDELDDENPVVVVDGLPAQFKKSILAWAEDSEVFDAEDYRATVVLIGDDDPTTLAMNQDVIERVGSKVDYAIVYNPCGPETGVYGAWLEKNSSNWRSEGLNWRSATLPPLEAVPIRTMDYHTRSLIGLLDDVKEYGIHRLEANRLRRRWKLYVEAFKRLGDVLLPIEEEASSGSGPGE